MTGVPVWVYVILLCLNLAGSAYGLATKDIRGYFATLATGLVLLVLLFVR